MKARDKLWRYATRNLNEGEILPRRFWWLKAVLYPLRFFYWRMGQDWGYQYERDAWRIDGVDFSRRMLSMLGHADGEVYRIYTERDCDRVVVRMVLLGRGLIAPTEIEPLIDHKQGLYRGNQYQTWAETNRVSGYQPIVDPTRRQAGPPRKV